VKFIRVVVFALLVIIVMNHKSTGFDFHFIQIMRIFSTFFLSLMISELYGLQCFGISIFLFLQMLQFLLNYLFSPTFLVIFRMISFSFLVLRHPLLIFPLEKIYFIYLLTQT